MRTVRPSTRRALGVQAEREVLQWRETRQLPDRGVEETAQHDQPLCVAQRGDRIVVGRHAPDQRGALNRAFALQRQQGHGPLAREALEGRARQTAFERDLSDPRRLPVVVRDRLARLIGEHAAFGDHREVEALGDAGVDLDAAAVTEALQCRDRRAEAAVQTLRFARAGGQPRRLQRRHDVAVAQHRTEHRHGLVGGADAQFGLAERGPARRLLRHMHLENRLRAGRIPGAEPLEQLHAAERERQRARVARDVELRRAGIEYRHRRLRQRARRVQRQAQAHRTGAYHGKAERRIEGGGVRHAFLPCSHEGSCSGLHYSP